MSYQLYNLGIVLEIKELVEEAGEEAPALDILLEKAQEFTAYSILPDGTMPAIGDTVVPDSLTEAVDLLRVVKNPDSALETVLKKSYAAELEHDFLVWPIANMAIIRTGSSDTLNHIFFMGSNFGQTHKHDDDLSFTFYTGGNRFIVDTGYDDLKTMYKSKNNVSEYREAYAHNVLVSDRSSWHGRGDRKLTRLTGYVSAGNIIAIQGEHRRIPETLVRRTLVFVNNRHLYIIDQISAEKEQSFSQLLHIDPGIEVSRSGNTFSCNKNGFSGSIVPITEFSRIESYGGLDHSPPAFVFRDGEILDGTAIRLTRDGVRDLTMKVLVTAHTVTGDIPEIDINGDEIVVQENGLKRRIELKPVHGETVIRLSR
jgi:hypothetical protein